MSGQTLGYNFRFQSVAASVPVLFPTEEQPRCTGTQLFKRWQLSRDRFIGFSVAKRIERTSGAKNPTAAKSAQRTSSLSKCCAPSPTSALGKPRCSVERLRERQLWAVLVEARPHKCSHAAFAAGSADSRDFNFSATWQLSVFRNAAATEGTIIKRDQTRRDRSSMMSHPVFEILAKFPHFVHQKQLPLLVFS